MLDCPGGTFHGAGVKTVVLFFEKGSPTRKVWYYQLDPGRSMGKTNALNDDDLKEFVALQASFADSEKSWSVDVKGIDRTSFDLSVKNPNKAEEITLRDAPGHSRRDSDAGCGERGGAGNHSGIGMMGVWKSKELGAVSVISYGYTESASFDPIGPRIRSHHRHSERPRRLGERALLQN